MMRRQQHGMTLIELIIAIVVIGLCVVSMLSLLSSLSMRSAVAMTRTQATAVAASYLESVLAMPAAAVAAYSADHLGAQDATGTAIAGLEQYRVEVVVVPDTLGSAPNNIPASRVEVTVTDPTGARNRLTGYRVTHGGKVLH